MTRRTEARRLPRRYLAALCLVALTAPAIPAAPKVLEPLPLEVVTNLRMHSARTPIDLSLDGAWLAQTYNVSDALEPGSSWYSATGVPLTEGAVKKRARLINTRSGEVIELGAPQASSWAPVWSPDGERVAYYSDEGGMAGVWIWERATGRALRFPGVISRAFFAAETLRWFPDGSRLLAKILPEGMQVAAPAASTLEEDTARLFPKVPANKPSVFVLRAPAGKAQPSTGMDAATPAGNAISPTQYALSDLAVLDLRTKELKRLVVWTEIAWYALSSDAKYLAYTELAGEEPDSQQSNYALKLLELASGERRTLAEKLRFNFGISLSWSPDGHHIAYVTTGPRASGECFVVSVTDGAIRKLGEGGPKFLDPTGLAFAPLWDADGANIYLPAGGLLWRLQTSSGKATSVGIPGRWITGVVSRPELETIWSKDNGRTVWVTARATEGFVAGIYELNLANGSSWPAIEDERHYLSRFNLDASDHTGEVAFSAEDATHPVDVWLLDTVRRKARRPAPLNTALEHYDLGTTRLVQWLGVDGQALQGALLLPAGYRPGERYPLVVWVYGGAYGSKELTKFGLGWAQLSGVFNFHALTTRGFAVLYPDAPLRVGMTMKDHVSTVMPGVNKLIELGIADPDRLAVMGQSYGSYSALSLITQTKRFKAAVVTAAVVNPELVSGYLHMSPEGGAGSIGWYEEGTGAMGGTPWEFPQRYRDNSPVYLFDRIETPLLIGQGSKDSPLAASASTFTALRRLGKEVEYRLYENEGHVLMFKPNVIDFWERRLQWLDLHLDISRDATGRAVFNGDRVRSRESL